MIDDPNHVDWAALVPAVIGSGVAALMDSKASLKQSVIGFISGASVSYFLAPALAQAANMESPRVVGAVGFMLGLTGWALARWIVRTAEEGRWQELPVIGRFFTGGK